VLGATVAGLAFVLPSFFMVLALGFAYVQFGGLPWMQAVFYGIGAAVIGIIAIGTYKLTKKASERIGCAGFYLRCWPLPRLFSKKKSSG
jgi:chromate transporter